MPMGEEGGTNKLVALLFTPKIGSLNQRNFFKWTCVFSVVQSPLVADAATRSPGRWRDAPPLERWCGPILLDAAACETWDRQHARPGARRDGLPQGLFEGLCVAELRESDSTELCVRLDHGRAQ